VRPVLVVVPAAAGLPAQPPRRHHPRLEHARLPARLAERELVERLRHGVADVDPHEVHQLERAHLEAAAEAADAVDLRGRRHALLNEPKGLRAEGPHAAVHQEARAVRHHDHVLSHRLTHLARHRQGPLAALLGADHLEQPHQRWRVEEVHAHHVLRLRGSAGERRDGDRRGVRGEHRVRRQRRQLGEQLALEVG
jgi:hypothetical protein